MAGKRALVLNHNLRERGTYFRAWKVARGLARHGWEVTFATTSEGWYRARRGRREGIDVWEMPNWSPLHQPDEGWGPLNALWRMGVAGNGQWDVVYSFSHRPVDQLPACVARMVHRATWVCDWCDLYGDEGLNAMARAGRGAAQGVRERLHDRIDRIDSHLEKQAARKCDLLTVISSFLAERAQALGRPPQRIHKMVSGADLERIRPLDRLRCRTHWGLNAGRAYLGYMANFHPDEHLLLDALRIVCARRANVDIIVAGHEFYGGKRALVERGLENRVRHFGRIPFARIGTFLGAADLLLVPMTDTPYNRSRWPNKIGDHLAAGRPQIACNVGDVREFMGKHNAGLGCEPDAHSMAEAMITLIDDPGRAREMGRTARAVAEEHFDWNGIVDELVGKIEIAQNVKNGI